MSPLRVVLVSVTVAVSIAVPSAAILLPAMLGAQLAYDGPRRRTLAWFTAALVLVELVGGFDLGVLSLSYMTIALLLFLAERVIAVSPWTVHHGWRAADLFRTWVTACLLAVALMVCSVLIGAVYGHAATAERLAYELAPGRSWLLLPLCLGFVCVLRRIEVPFRRPIRFGTS